MVIIIIMSHLKALRAGAYTDERSLICSSKMQRKPAFTEPVNADKPPNTGLPLVCLDGL